VVRLDRHGRATCAALAVSCLWLIVGSILPAVADSNLQPEWKLIPVGDASHGTRDYSDYESARACASCHVDIFQQWTRSMMSQAYVHSWDEIEYFKLAVPHAERKAKVAGVKDGCNGCHAPIAFLAGDTPPPPPGSGGLADEGVTCDLCHSVVGFSGDTPYNFNWISNPGDTKYGGRGGLDSPYHETERNEFLQSADFCGTCHNEMSPYGVWVKSTHLEWSEGPYAAEGVPCQDCHMPPGPGALSVTAEPVEDMRHHLFHGAHVPSKLRGAIELVMWCDTEESEPGETMKLSLALFNQKAGHKIPTGSAEDRQLWVTVEAIDANGVRYHLPVDLKGFDGEEQTITSDELAYQDMGEAMGDAQFAGVARDATPYLGDRMFCLPYFDDQGRRTIQQWNTASLGVDYRIGPRETRVETYTWTLPDEIPEGELRFEASLNYRRLVKSVGDFLGVPEEETETFLMNTGSTSVEVVY
jgi:hypothetical protein